MKKTQSFPVFMKILNPSSATVGVIRLRLIFPHCCRSMANISIKAKKLLFS